MNFSSYIYFCVCMFYTFIYLVDSVDRCREFVLKYVRAFMYVLIQVGRLVKFFYVGRAL